MSDLIEQTLRDEIRQLHHTCHDIVAEIREANIFLREALGIWADEEWSDEEIKTFSYLIPLKKAYEILRDY